MMRLDNKVAFVTGGASGIGKAIAQCYATAGAKVVIADLNQQQAEQVAKEMAQQYQTKTLGLSVDVSNEAMVDEAIDRTVKELGSLDVLNANAGIQTICDFAHFDYAAWQRLINIHLGGAFLTSKAAMKKMIESGKGGRIIVTGSVHSFEASKEKSAYVTAKHGQLGMVRALALEGAKYNIAANLIGPGFVKTPLVEKQIPEQAKALGLSEEEVIKKVMLGKTVDGEFTSLEDIARASLFCASFPTLGFTGQSMIISHGWHMQ